MSSKILVVDDSVTIQKVIKLALGPEGYEVIAVPSIRDSLKAIETERPHVVLLDYSLPDGNVEQFLSEYHQLTLKGVSTHILLMHSAFEAVDIAKVKSQGVEEVLSKPFDPQHLRQKIQLLLAGVLPPQELSSFEGHELRESDPNVVLIPEYKADDWALEDTKNREVPEESTFQQANQMGHESFEKMKEWLPEPEGESQVLSLADLKEEPIFRSEPTPQFAGPSQVSQPVATSSVPTLEAVSTTAAPAPGAVSASEEVFRAPLESPYYVPSERIEALVRQGVEEKLDRIIRDVVPKLAEQLIKREIERILSEP